MRTSCRDNSDRLLMAIWLILSRVVRFEIPLTAPRHPMLWFVSELKVVGFLEIPTGGAGRGKSEVMLLITNSFFISTNSCIFIFRRVP